MAAVPPVLLSARPSRRILEAPGPPGAAAAAPRLPRPLSPWPRPRPARFSCPLLRAARSSPCGTAGPGSSAARPKPERGCPGRALRAAAAIPSLGRRHRPGAWRGPAQRPPRAQGGSSGRHGPGPGPGAIWRTEKRHQKGWGWEGSGYKAGHVGREARPGAACWQQNGGYGIPTKGDGEASQLQLGTGLLRFHFLPLLLFM